MRIGFLAAAMAIASPAADAATTYRFTNVYGAAPPVTGTVWLQAAHARLEFDPGEDPIRNGNQIQISRDGGNQLLTLNTKERTFYDQTASLSQKGLKLRPPSTRTLGVPHPLTVRSVGKPGVEITEQGIDQVAGYPCHHIALSLSYTMVLGLAGLDERMKATVKAQADLWFADNLPAASLPFGHDHGIRTNQKEIDEAVALALSKFSGLLIKRTLTAMRQIEGGEAITDTESMTLEGFHEADVPPDHFEVPPGYRYQEPIIVAPKRVN